VGIIAAPAHAGYDEATALQGNVGHTGFASGGTLDRPPLHQRWSRTLGASLSYPVIADGKAFVASSGSTSTPQIRRWTWSPERGRGGARRTAR
jgi:hypothetical protein